MANTQATDNQTLTNIDDRAFQIGSVAAANANALNNLDTVVIDVTDLFNTGTGALKATLAGRYVDLTSLNASGAAVRFTYNGQANLTLAQLAALVPNAVVNTADAGTPANVLGGVAVAVLPVNTGITFASGIGAQNVLGTNNNDTFTLTQSDIVAGGTGSDTVNLNAGSAAAQVTLGAGADTININTAIAGTNAAVVTTGAASTVNITVDQGAGADLTQEIVGAFAHTYNVSANQTALTVLNTAGATISATAGGTFTLGAAGQIFTSSGANNVVVNGGAGVDTITLGNTGTGTVTAAGGIDTITITAATGVTTVVVAAAAADRDTVTGFSATNDIIALTAANTTVGTAAAATPVVQSVAAAGAVLLASATADITVFNYDMGGTTSVLDGVLNGAALLANVGGAVTAAANTDDGYILAYDNGNAYLYAFTNSTAAGVLATEIALIGTFNGVAVGALGVANFALI